MLSVGVLEVSAGQKFVSTFSSTEKLVWDHFLRHRRKNLHNSSRCVLKFNFETADVMPRECASRDFYLRHEVGWRPKRFHARLHERVSASSTKNCVQKLRWSLCCCFSRFASKLGNYSQLESAQSVKCRDMLVARNGS
jgi:hypothetical protein